MQLIWVAFTRRSLHDGVCSNSSHHKGGIIGLAWNPRSFGVNIITMNSLMIHRLVNPSSGGNGFFCSFIYAFNDALNMRSVWNMLKEYATKLRGPRMISGDFNCVIYSDERIRW